MYYNLIILLLAIPIIAILANAYTKSQKNMLEKERYSFDKSTISDLTLKIKQLEEENKSLKERVQHVETIVTHPDWEILLQTMSEDEKTAQKARALADKLKE